MPDLHPEVEALFKTSPTCSHGNYCEADARRIAALAVQLEREECAKQFDAIANNDKDSYWKMRRTAGQIAAHLRDSRRRGKP